MNLRTKIVAAVASGALLTSTLTGVASAAEVRTGIDVSSHNHESGPVNWADVTATGKDFAFIKASESTNYTNPFWVTDVNLAHTSGVAVGGYHYARPDKGKGDAAAEADFFADHLIAAVGPTLPPVLDMEESGGLTPDELADWTGEFLDRLEKRTGRVPMIYTYPNFWATQMGNTSRFAQYPLWIAHYVGASEPWVPGGWSDWTFWQTTSDGAVAGIDGVVDLNVFNGSPEDLASMER